jgi:hypothetical protein
MLHGIGLVVLVVLLVIAFAVGSAGVSRRWCRGWAMYFTGPPRLSRLCSAS